MPTPHRMLQKLLGLVLPTAWADDALGDLREEFLEWRKARGRLQATVRLVVQGLGLLAYGFLDHASQSLWVVQDLPDTIRRNLRRPAVPLVGALALGPVLGAAGAFGSVLFSALAGPLPHADPDRLIVVTNAGGEMPSSGQSEALHRRYAEELHALQPLGLFHHLGANVLFPHGARRVPVVRATAAALRVVGADVEAGRMLESEDDWTSAPPTTVLTHRAWMARWNGDPAAVGSEVVVDGRARRIVGVLAPDIRLPGPRPELVLSAGLARERTPATAFTWTASIGRLADGADAASAAEEIEGVFREMAHEDPRLGAVSEPPGGIGPSVLSVRRWHARQVLPTLAVGFGGSIVLLVLTVAAPLTLLLSTSGDSTQRNRVRRALGATRVRLRAQAAWESVAALGGAFGVGAACAGAAVRGLGTAIAVPLDSWTDPGRAAWAALFCGLCVVPPMAAIRVGRPDPSQGRRRPSAGRLLFGAQAAAAVLLLTALAASARSAWTLANRDLGFDAAGLLTFGAVLPDWPYQEDVRRAIAFHERVKAGLLGLPEVDAVSYGLGMPVSHPGWAKPWEVDGPTDTTRVPTSHPYRTVAPGYFGMLGIPLLAGHVFQGVGPTEIRRALVVNEAFARAYWDSPREALGQRLRPVGSSRWAQVVGVVGNTADRGVAAPYSPMVYEPVTAVGDPRRLLTLQYVVRGSHLGAQTIRSARRILAEMDPQVPAFGFETGEGLILRDLARERLSLTFLAATALVGLLAAALGLGGLVLLTISRRSREIGVRKALGGSDARLRLHSLAAVWRPVIVGISAGVVLVAAGLRVPPALLHDAGTWKEHALMALLILTPILSVAGYLGSRRVLRIEPVEAFRE